MIITKFVEQGNLRNFINNNFITLSWLQKLELLQSIAIGLNKIHSSGLSHNDFHSGNILVSNEKSNLSIFISDLGISGPADRSYDPFGVMQYTPPEILRGHNYTKYSDVYFFSMLMYEISVGVPPFINVSRDQLNDLIFDICDGLRPIYNSKYIPKSFEKIMKQCWDDDEFNRPLISQLVDIIGNWIKEIKENNINSQFNKCEQQIRLKYPLYKYDIYKSQQIKTTDLGKEDFEHDDDNEELNFNENDSDEDIELNEDFERRVQNRFVKLTRKDLMKWLENVDESFDPNRSYPR
ncbi:kinase-like protein [Rhizophagus irregularis]|nr:kinase-like protein [Rhizophagus irregularis]